MIHARPRAVLLVRRSPLNRSLAVVQAGPLRLRAAIGRGGTSAFKREGDGATPIAAMDLLAVWRRAGRMAGLHTALPQKAAGHRDGWCDAPGHPAYNRPVRFPFAASAETMRRDDRLYDVVVVLDWNIRSRARGRGSAIFLHIAKEGYEPTAGCVALHPRDMRRIAPFLRRNSRLRVLS